MIHVAELDESHIPELSVEMDSLQYLDTMGYPVDVTKSYVVVNHKPDGENSGYIVQKIESTSVPLEQADIVADKTTVYVCSCPSYRYQEGIPDLEERHLSEWSACKHVEATDKAVKAENDENQTRIQ